MLCIEIKTGAARQEDEQISFQRQIEERGGLYVILRTRDDLEKLYAKLARHTA